MAGEAAAVARAASGSAAHELQRAQPSTRYLQHAFPLPEAGMNREHLTVFACIVAVLASVPAAAQTTIDFNDGTQSVAIGAFYAGLGVTFSNASWDGFVSPNEGDVGAGGLKMVANVGDRFQPKADNPIVAIFAADVFAISIRGLNVGANGARIVAFDIFNAVLGMSEAFGVGLGVDNHPLLSINAAGIRRVEFYQPESVMIEGMLWDNLVFEARQTVVPEPVTMVLMATGLAGLAVVRRRRGLTAVDAV
jgi:hypothetical protein